MHEKYQYGPFRVDTTVPFTRADLEFYRINHFRPSYTVDIFFNDPDIDLDADTSRGSYAGSFSVFAHPRCAGGAGHCDVPTTRRRFDDRPSHPLTRAFKRVVVTDALKRVTGNEIMVTVIAACDPDVEMEYEGPLLEFSDIGLSVFG